MSYLDFDRQWTPINQALIEARHVVHDKYKWNQCILHKKKPHKIKEIRTGVKMSPSMTPMFYTEFICKRWSGSRYVDKTTRITAQAQEGYPVVIPDLKPFDGIPKLIQKGNESQEDYEKKCDAFIQNLLASFNAAPHDVMWCLRNANFTGLGNPAAVTMHENWRGKLRECFTPNLYRPLCDDKILRKDEEITGDSNILLKLILTDLADMIDDTIKRQLARRTEQI